MNVGSSDRPSPVDSSTRMDNNEPRAIIPTSTNSSPSRDDDNKAPSSADQGSLLEEKLAAANRRATIHNKLVSRETAAGGERDSILEEKLAAANRRSTLHQPHPATNSPTAAILPDHEEHLFETVASSNPRDSTTSTTRSSTTSAGGSDILDEKLAAAHRRSTLHQTTTTGDEFLQQKRAAANRRSTMDQKIGPGVIVEQVTVVETQRVPSSAQLFDRQVMERRVWRRNAEGAKERRSVEGVSPGVERVRGIDYDGNDDDEEEVYQNEDLPMTELLERKSSFVPESDLGVAERAGGPPAPLVTAEVSFAEETAEQQQRQGKPRRRWILVTVVLVIILAILAVVLAVVLSSSSSSSNEEETGSFGSTTPSPTAPVTVPPTMTPTPALFQLLDQWTAPNNGAADQFGISVAVHGDIAVVGSWYPAEIGSAHVFVRSGLSSSWTHQATLTANDAEAGDEFGNAVAVYGDRIAVGASKHPVASRSGSVYVFQQQPAGNWTLETKLTAPDAADQDRFGSSVAMSDDAVVVGAVRDDDAGSGSGSVYVFVKNNVTSWDLQAKLTSNDGQPDDAFGTSVSMDNNTIVVGALRNYVDVFFREGSDSWTQQAKLTANDAAVGDLFGISVAIDGDVVIVGASQDEVSTGVQSGSAYVYERSVDASWSQQAKLVPNDGSNGDLFGYSVSVNNGVAVVGAFQADAAGLLNNGGAYVFVRQGTTSQWIQTTKLLAPDPESFDLFGTSVSLSNSTVIVGAPGDSTVSGSVYAYELFPV